MENKDLSDINNSFEFINLMSQENLSLSEVYYNLSHYYLGIDKVPEQKILPRTVISGKLLYEMDDLR